MKKKKMKKLLIELVNGKPLHDIGIWTDLKQKHKKKFLKEQKD